MRTSVRYGQLTRLPPPPPDDVNDDYLFAATCSLTNDGLCPAAYAISQELQFFGRLIEHCAGSVIIEGVRHAFIHCFVQEPVLAVLGDCTRFGAARGCFEPTEKQNGHN